MKLYFYDNYTVIPSYTCNIERLFGVVFHIFEIMVSMPRIKLIILVSLFISLLKILKIWLLLLSRTLNVHSS